MLSFYIIIVIVKNKSYQPRFLLLQSSLLSLLSLSLLLSSPIVILSRSYILYHYFLYFLLSLSSPLSSPLSLSLLAFYVIFRPWQDSRVHPKFVRFTSSTFSSLRFRPPYSSLSSPHPLCFPFPLPILFLYLTFFPPLPFPSPPYSPSPSLSPFPFHLA